MDYSLYPMVPLWPHSGYSEELTERYLLSLYDTKSRYNSRQTSQRITYMRSLTWFSVKLQSAGVLQGRF